MTGMIGRIVGSYRIVEKIGEGGMGAVYRAVDVMLDRDVALKAIRPELSHEPQIVERFRAEARTLARLNHPAIAAIYSFFHDGEDLYLAMELVEGRPLSKVLEAQGAIPWQRAVHLLGSAMEGIEQAHRDGVVHRDLKPDNLMLTEAGTLKVMDFGIARVMGSGHLTRTGLLVGTLRYMSPEQIRGEEVDGRADVYALGAVLYEMLTGRPPFEGGSDWAILRAQIEDPPRPPGEHRPELPWWLDRVVLKALSKQAAERFQTVEEMRLALLRQGETMIGSRPSDPAAATPLEELETVVTPPGARSTPVPVIHPTKQPGPAPTSYRPVELGSTSGSGWKVAALAAALVAVLVAAGIGTWLWRGRTGEPQTQAQSSPPGTEPAVTVTAAGQQSPSSLPAGKESTPTPPPATPAPRRDVEQRLPEPQDRDEPPVPTPAVEAPASRPSNPEEPAVAEPQTAAPIEPAPGAPIQEVHRLAGELETESRKLYEVYERFLESKEEAGGEITDTDEQLQENLEALMDDAESLNKQFQSGLFARVRKRQPGDRLRVQQRFRALAQRGEKVERLMGEVQPGPEVRQSWQQVRRRWRRIGDIMAGI